MRANEARFLTTPRDFEVIYGPNDEYRTDIGAAAASTTAVKWDQADFLNTGGILSSISSRLKNIEGVLNNVVFDSSLGDVWIDKVSAKSRRARQGAVVDSAVDSVRYFPSLDKDRQSDTAGVPLGQVPFSTRALQAAMLRWACVGRDNTGNATS